MRHTAQYILVAGSLVFGTWTALGGASGVSDVSRALLPSAPVDVRQVHDVEGHAKQKCVVCHERASGSRWASERLLPDMETCASCHQAAAGVTPQTPFDATCRACHEDIEPGKRPMRRVGPRPNIRFSHAAHGDSVSCGRCHVAAGQRRARTTRRDVIGMRECYDCHERGRARTTCRTCHVTRPDGKILTELGGLRMTPPAWLVGPTHNTGWVGDHAGKAAANSSLCASCHQERFCRDCHSGRLRPRRVHNGDWVQTHGVNTRLDSPRCKGCHRKQSFCLTCHRRAGVAPDSPPRSRPEGGGGRYHGTKSNRELMRRAKHNIVTCVSCHSESSCISCHGSRNPHPPGWSRKCGRQARRSVTACMKCHTGRPWERCQ